MATLVSGVIDNTQIKVRWEEPFVSDALNKKVFGILPRGVYSGFVVTAGPGDRDITITNTTDIGCVSGFCSGTYDTTSGYSIAIHENINGQQTTISARDDLGQFTLDLTGLDSQTVFATLDVDYLLGQQTAAFVKIVNAAEMNSDPTLINLAKINMPAVSIPITAPNIVTDDPVFPRIEPYAERDKFGFMSTRQQRAHERLKSMAGSELSSDGTIQWEVSAANTLEWSATIRIKILNRSFSYTIAADSLSVSDQTVVYVNVQDLAGGVLTPLTTTIGTFTFDEAEALHYPLFFRDGSKIYSPYGDLVLEPGETGEFGGAESSSTTEAGGVASIEPANGFQSALDDQISVGESDPSSNIRSAETNASFDSAKKLYRVLCDKTKTFTSTGTTFSISGVPSYTIATGDIIFDNASGDFRRVATLTDQQNGTIDTAFAPDLSSASGMISQAVWTKDIVNLGDAAEETRFRDIFGAQSINFIQLEYQDSLVVADNVPDITETARISASASNEGLVSGVSFPTSDLFTTPIYTRPVAPSQVSGYDLSPNTDDERLFLVFFCNPNNASVTSTANLLQYKVSLYETETVDAQVERLETQVMNWAYTGTPSTGDVLPWLQVPFDHELVSGYAVAKTAGSTGSTIVIEFATQASIDSAPSFTDVFTTGMTLDATERSTNTAATPAVLDPTLVNRVAGDHYRVRVPTVGTGLSDLTVQLRIRLKSDGS